uniref:Uncharacterized protein n=1 Tax=Sus scrofa TaxID=9823 RepID=A0A8D1J6Q6_PIG
MWLTRGPALPTGPPDPQGDVGSRRPAPPWGGNEAAGAETSGTAPLLAAGAGTEEAECRHRNRDEGQ